MVFIDPGDEPCHGITETGGGGRISLVERLSNQFRLPITPLLVEVLFPRPGHPPSSYVIECRSNFEDAMARGIVGRVTHANDNIPFRWSPAPRAQHATSDGFVGRIFI
jgi:hypothetical protein